MSESAHFDFNLLEHTVLCIHIYIAGAFFQAFELHLRSFSGHLDNAGICGLPDQLPMAFHLQLLAGSYLLVFLRICCLVRCRNGTHVTVPNPFQNPKEAVPKTFLGKFLSQIRISGKADERELALYHRSASKLRVIFDLRLRLSWSASTFLALRSASSDFLAASRIGFICLSFISGS